MKIINLTKHNITVENGTKKAIYPKSGILARVDLGYKQQGQIDGFPVVTHRVLQNNLPNPMSDTIYIVSAIVLEQVKYIGRTDCVAPDSNHARRDRKGTIMSVPGWVS